MDEKAQGARVTDAERRAEALRSELARLETIDRLLNASTVGFDGAAVFDRLFEIAATVMPHHTMVVLRCDDAGMLRLYAVAGGLSELPIPLGTRIPNVTLLEGLWEYELIDDLLTDARYRESHSAKRGMRSLLALPIRTGSALEAIVSFLDTTPHHFTTRDVAVARRIADRVAMVLFHQELRTKSTSIELLDELLGTLSASGPLNEVFDRISSIASKVLPHDALFLPVYMADGKTARRYTSSGVDTSKLPDVIEIQQWLRGNDWEYQIVDDVATEQSASASVLIKQGYRSALRVPVRLDGRTVAALAFVSRTPSAYKHDDVTIARRMASRLAVSLANERGVEAMRRVDEATARAAKLEARVRELTEELDARTGYRRVIGNSPPWKQVLTQAAQVSVTETTVLLLGESGTGKEVVARLLHRASPRRDGPFIALNCAALPEHLLEAELFGFERGAFTGATQSKPGQLEQAAGGVLFLDEVAEMSPSAQAKFLRVLQEREFQRLGGTRVLKTDARIVAATNRDLQKAIASGHFREDLFYRLNVFAIRLPPLRERREDILPLSQAFLNEFARSFGRSPAGISRESKQMLVDYHWPGNVRELRNILERAAILCEGGLIACEHLALIPLTPAHVAPPPAPLDPPLDTPPTAAAPSASPPASAALASDLPAGPIQTMERAMIEKALQDARFNKSKAAKTLGLTRRQLYVRMRRYGLE